MALKVIQPGQVIDTSPRNSEYLRKLAAAMMQQGQIRTVGQGINSAAKSLAGAYLAKQAQEREAKEKAEIGAIHGNATEAMAKGLPGWNTPDALYTDPTTGMQSSEPIGPRAQPDVMPGTEVIAPTEPGMEAAARVYGQDPRTAAMASAMMQQSAIDKLEQDRAAKAAAKAEAERVAQRVEERGYKEGLLDEKRAYEEGQDKIKRQHEKDLIELRNAGRAGTQLTVDPITGAVTFSQGGSPNIIPAPPPRSQDGAIGASPASLSEAPASELPDGKPRAASLALTNKGQKTVEEQLMSLDDSIAGIEDIANRYNPDLLTFGGQVKGTWQGIKAKVNPSLLSDSDKAEYSAFRDLRIAAGKNFAKVLKEMSGAAVTAQEMPRQEVWLPTAGSGLFDGDDPIEFERKIKFQQNYLASTKLRYQNYIMKGIPVDSASAKIPLKAPALVKNPMTGKMEEYWFSDFIDEFSGALNVVDGVFDPAQAEAAWRMFINSQRRKGN